MIDVLCVGHIAWDLNLRLAGYPVEDSKGGVNRLLQSGGGPAANAAFLLAGWGVRCAFAGVVGDDEYGRRSLRELGERGVDVSWSEARPGHTTPVSVVLVNEANGSRTILTYKAETHPLALPTPPGESPSPRVVLYDGHEVAASHQAIRAYPSAIRVFDAGSHRDGSDELAREADYLVCSERFAARVIGRPDLTGVPDDQAVAAAWELSRKQTPVVITCGARGLLHGSPGRVERLPAYRVKAVDTTAAGDFFHGAFVYGVLNGWDWLDTLRLASMTAARSVTGLGGRPSAPSLPEVQSSMKAVDGSWPYG